MRVRLTLATLVALLCGACGSKAPVTQPSPSAGPANGTSPHGTATPLTFKVRSSGEGHGAVVLTERRKTRTIYVLRADANVSNRFGAGTGRSTFTQPRIVFYQDGGRRLMAQSPTADVEEQTKTVVMNGGVHAHTQDGVTLSCDQLVYDDRHGTIHGSGNVLVTSPHGETLSGDTLDADLQLNHVRVSGVGT
ncbi:MAG: LPS export ABC transporter periplasmic protein LptC [Candidatus Eremiobacteraeota bacterium]|nr:LPS export ABC transporter periplasmic protein LptC [Candidatus Eremiobacteraeota bacterium]